MKKRHVAVECERSIGSSKQIKHMLVDIQYYNNVWPISKLHIITDDMRARTTTQLVEFAELNGIAVGLYNSLEVPLIESMIDECFGFVLFRDLAQDINHLSNFARYAEAKEIPLTVWTLGT